MDGSKKEVTAVSKTSSQGVELAPMVQSESEESELSTTESQNAGIMAWLASKFQAFFPAAVDALAGDEKRRFLTGSVLVPLAIAALAVFMGERISADFQDWQDRRTRARDLIEGVRKASTVLSSNLDLLARKGNSLERLRTNTIISDEITAVDESLLILRGMVTALRENSDIPSSPKSDLMPSIENCKQNVDVYVDCLRSAVDAPVTAKRDQDACTTGFRERIKEKGSCNSVESTAYAIVY